MQVERNNVVVHFKDGRLLKGYTHDFTPMKELFHLNQEAEGSETSVCEVKVSDLKAVFFVKQLMGDKDYIEKKRFEETDAARLHGIKIKVEFKDGEIIRAFSLGYSKGKKGFFVIPIDPLSNNERIFVIADSTSRITVGSGADA